MDRFFQTIASSQAFAKLQRDCVSGQLKHAYVFASADFDALEALTALFISFAETGKIDDFVLSRIADGGYLDIVRLPRPEKNGKMDVEDATYLTDTAYLMPTELKTKYYIVAPREPLSAPVQNKLLKTLEEPPSSARFLIFSGGGELLPTVSSRCALVRLEEFPIQIIERELTDGGADEVTALFAAAVSRGNMGTARKIASDPTYRKVYETAVNFLLNVKRSPQILPTASELIAFKDKTGVFADYLELIFRDVMAYHACGAQAVVLKPAIRDIITLAREWDTDTVLAVLPLLTHARERLRLYGNAASVVDELLFSVLEVKAKCLKS